MMYRADPRVQNIANILGHSDTKTTSLYLGLDLEDQSAIMLKYAQYPKAAIIPETGISGVSQENGGPCGI